MHPGDRAVYFFVIFTVETKLSADQLGYLLPFGVMGPFSRTSQDCLFAFSVGGDGYSGGDDGYGGSGDGYSDGGDDGDDGYDGGGGGG